VPGDDPSGRLGLRRRVLLDLHQRTHSVQDAEQPDPGGVEPDILDPQFASGHQKGPNEEERGRGEVARDGERRARIEPLDWADGDPAGGASADGNRPNRLRRHIDPGRLQHALRVVACGRGLDDPRLPVREESREQHARLHLGAGDRKPVHDPAEL
jgi:hypothetical protein